MSKSKPNYSPTMHLKKGPTEGWIETTLNKLLLSLKSGTRPKGGVRDILKGIPSIGAEHLNDIGGFRFDKIKYVPEDFYQKMLRGHICTGDVLVVKDGATTGKVSLVRSDFPYPKAVVNEHVFICRPAEGVLPAFLFWSLYSKEGQERILENFKGSAQGGINLGFAPGTIVLLAPLTEQKRIVTKVEELMERVNDTRARIAKVPSILKRFRQSVLIAACSGQLSAEWRKGQKTEMFLEKQSFPITWSRQSLSNVCEAFEYGSSKKSDLNGEIPVLRMGNLQDGSIDWLELKYSSDSAEIEKYSLEPNTVLFNRTNSPELVGKTAIYRGERPAIFAGYLIRIIQGPHLDPEFLNYSLNEQRFREYCIQVKSDGVSQSNINAKKLAGYDIYLPPLTEQREIVRRVKALFAKVAEIENRVKIATERVNQLTQSILARAFRGELVPTEAELAAKKGRDYESALELLERIQKEREQQKLAKGKSKGKKKKETITIKVNAVVTKKKIPIPLYDVLEANKRQMGAEELFQKANFDQNTVEQFYSELRDEIRKGRMKEIRPNDTDVFLELV